MAVEFGTSQADCYWVQDPRETGPGGQGQMYPFAKQTQSNPGEEWRCAQRPLLMLMPRLLRGVLPCWQVMEC